MIMTLLGWFLLTAVLIPLLYLWRRPAGIMAGLAGLLVPGGLYLWAGLSLRTYTWSWALPLLAGQCLLIPLVRFLYVRICRLLNGWSKFNLEIEDSNGHLHYVKGINQGTYINGGSGSGKTASCNTAYARHAAQFGMSVLVHDLKNMNFRRFFIRSSGLLGFHTMFLRCSIPNVLCVSIRSPRSIFPTRHRCARA